MKKYIQRDIFDFETGYFIKSPCLECKNRDNSPQCRETCVLLNEIRTLLARGVSSQKSSYEP